MREVTSPGRMQRLARDWLRAGVRTGLVPTMGCLHAGHLSLILRARRAVGPSGVVVVSLFVNPLQFGPKEDLNRYPRPLAKDRRLCREAGVDVLFVPDTGSMYPSPPGAAFSTYVVEEDLSRGMEGGSRPTHFRGVTTVVARLFHLVQPEVAVFGAKDFQQAMIVRRMVRDLAFPVRIQVAPTVREADGLALSSRNRYLSAEERAQAPVLWEVLNRLRERVRAAGNRGVAASTLQREAARRVAACPAARLDYLEFFCPETLRPRRRVVRGTRAALAVFLGRTRLIDNLELD